MGNHGAEGVSPERGCSSCSSFAGEANMLSVEFAAIYWMKYMDMI